MLLSFHEVRIVVSARKTLPFCSYFTMKLQSYMNAIQKGIPEVDEVPASELKTKIKELHQRIVKGEGLKYDLEKRHERQEYDVSHGNWLKEILTLWFDGWYFTFQLATTSFRCVKFTFETD